jgi:type I restriction enzyme S subunit
MSETLEGIARAIFKSWLVDFDPVHAKVEGQNLGLPKHIENLIPDCFEDSELGQIPKGWGVGSLDRIAEFINGLALQKYPPRGDRSLPVIKIAQLRSGLTDGADRATAELDPAYIVKDGDVLFSWSGSLECVIWAGGPGALNQHLFKVTSEKYPSWLGYFGVHEHLDDFRHIAAGKATTMGHIQRHHLAEAKLAVPPPSLMEAIDAVIGPIFESIWRRKALSRTLSSLLDTLLPKLVSGDLRISDAERIIGKGV